MKKDAAKKNISEIRKVKSELQMTKSNNYRNFKFRVIVLIL